MKNKKALTLFATAITTVALVFGGATPANAVTNGGTINCPSNMHARVGFNSTYSGGIDWYTTSGVWFRSNTWGANSGRVTYRSYVSVRTGPVSWKIPAIYAHGDVSASCVV